MANDVWSVRVNGRLAVARRGARSDADLAWETELLQHLDPQPTERVLDVGCGTGKPVADMVARARSNALFRMSSQPLTLTSR